jgi:YVTN family beta-propeller protein
VSTKETDVALTTAPSHGSPIAKAQGSGRQSTSPLFVSLYLGDDARGPALPAFTPDKRKLVIPNELSDSVSVLDCDTLELDGTLYLGTGSKPWQAKVTLDGELAFVVNSRFHDSMESSPQEDASVSVVALSSLTVLEEIPVGAGPNGITIRAPGDLAFVANKRSNDLSIIDVASRRELQRVPVGNMPASVKCTKDGNFVVVVNQGDSSLTVVDTSSGTVVGSLVVGDPECDAPHPEWGSGDSTSVSVTSDYKAYVTNWRSHGIAVVDLRDMAVVKRFDSVLMHPFGVEIDEDVALVVVTSGAEDKFAIFDLECDELMEVFPADGTRLPASRAIELNFWMTEPASHRMRALLPRGLRGLREHPERSIVTKFM